MPVEGNAYAALVTELEAMLQLNGKTHFLSFPQVLVRLGLEDLLFDAQAVQQHTGLIPALAQKEALLNLEYFALIVNQIAESSNTFQMDSRMLWSIYERVISSPELATGGNEAAIQQTALMFQNLRGRFTPAALGSAQLGGGPFWATRILPPNDVTDPNGWTRIVLDRQLIADRSRQSSPATQAWLQERGLLEVFERVQGTSLSAEIFLLTLQRPWFEPAVFTNRLWRWDEAPLSDGRDPPEGLLPAYVTRLVLVRNLQMELNFASATPFSQFAPTVDFANYSFVHPAPSAPSTAANTNVAPQALALLAQPPETSQPLSLRQFATLTLTDGPNGDNALAFGTLNNQTGRFPAPVTFLTPRVVEQIAAAEVKLANELIVLNDRLVHLQENITHNDVVYARLQQQVDSYPPDAETVTVSTDPPNVIDVVALRQYLANAKADQEVDRARAANMERALRVHHQHARDLHEMKQYYESLSPSGDDSEIFVFGFVCSATPKSPDPDPAFFN